MTHTQDIQRPERRLVEALRNIGTATISGELRNLGIRNAAITGPRAITTGRISAGPALTWPRRSSRLAAAMPSGRSSRGFASLRVGTCASIILCARTQRPSIWPGKGRAARDRRCKDHATGKIIDLTCAWLTCQQVAEALLAGADP